MVAGFLVRDCFSRLVGIIDVGFFVGFLDGLRDGLRDGILFAVGLSPYVGVGPVSDTGLAVGGGDC